MSYMDKWRYNYAFSLRVKVPVPFHTVPLQGLVVCRSNVQTSGSIHGVQCNHQLGLDEKLDF